MARQQVPEQLPPAFLRLAETHANLRAPSGNLDRGDLAVLDRILRDALGTQLIPEVLKITAGDRGSVGPLCVRAQRVGHLGRRLRVISIHLDQEILIHHPAVANAVERGGQREICDRHRGLAQVADDVRVQIAVEFVDADIDLPQLRIRGVLVLFLVGVLGLGLGRFLHGGGIAGASLTAGQDEAEGHRGGHEGSKKALTGLPVNNCQDQPPSALLRSIPPARVAPRRG